MGRVVEFVSTEGAFNVRVILVFAVLVGAAACGSSQPSDGDEEATRIVTFMTGRDCIAVDSTGAQAEPLFEPGVAEAAWTWSCPSNSNLRPNPNTSFKNVLRDADLGGAILDGVNLSEVGLFDSNLSGASLQNARLSGAYLGGADLSGASLGGADLRGASLSGANLQDADLTGADLTGANLGSVELSGADLTGTILCDVEFFDQSESNADVSDAQLRCDEGEGVKPEPQLSTEAVQAADLADRYLEVSSFSRQGLVDQLVFEGFPVEVAVSAVDSTGTDWYEQAALTAVRYLEVSSFSRQGLVDQLVFEGFTSAEAEFGAQQVFG